MDLRSIRVALAAIAESFGFSTYSFLTESPSPPAVVVGFGDVTYGVTLKFAQVTLPVIVVVSHADMESATELLDASFSTQASSLVDAYNGAKDTSWKSCKVVSAGNVRRVTLGANEALAADIVLELIA